MFRKSIKIADSSSRVKMHKSGKNWVKILMSQFHLLNAIKGIADSEKNTYETFSDSEKLSSNRNLYKVAITTGTVLGGAAISNLVVEADTNTETLVGSDSVAISTTESAMSSNVTSDSENTVSSSRVVNLWTNSTSNTSLASETSESQSTQSETNSMSTSESQSNSETNSQSIATVQLFAATAADATNTGNDVSSSVTSLTLNDVSQNHQTSEIQNGTTYNNDRRSPGTSFDFTFKKDSVSAGDYVTFTLSDTINAAGITTSKIVIPPLTLPDGTQIAEGVYDSSKNTITYTFNNNVAGKTDISAGGHISIYFDQKNVPTNQDNVNISVTSGTKIASKTVNVTYDSGNTDPNETQAGADYTVDSRVIAVNHDTGNVKYITQVNAPDVSFNQVLDPSTSYKTVIGNATDQDALKTGILTEDDLATRAQVDMSNATYKIYKVSDASKLVPGMVQDYSDTSLFTDVTDSIDSKIVNGNIEITWPSKMSDAYVVVVDGTMKGTQKTGKDSVALISTFGKYKTYTNQMRDGSGYTFATKFDDNSASANADSTSTSTSNSTSESGSTSDSTSGSGSSSESDSTSNSTSDSGSSSESGSTSDSTSNSGSSSESGSTSDSTSDSGSSSESGSTSDSTSNSGSSSESDSTSASSSESSSQVFVSSESTSQTPHKGSTSLPRTGDDHSASMAAGLGIGLVGLGLTVAKRKTNKSE